MGEGWRDQGYCRLANPWPADPQALHTAIPGPYIIPDTLLKVFNQEYMLDFGKCFFPASIEIMWFSFFWSVNIENYID